MGRTVPSFRNVLDMEKADWKPFRNALDRSERKDFDDMWDIPRLYLSACSNSVQLVPLHPIIMSILFHHYKELIQLVSEVEQMEEATIINNSKQRLMKDVKKEEIPAALDNYLEK
jgi:actin-related protein